MIKKKKHYERKFSQFYHSSIYKRFWAHFLIVLLLILSSGHISILSIILILTVWEKNWLTVQFYDYFLPLNQVLRPLQDCRWPIFHSYRGGHERNTYKDESWTYGLAGAANCTTIPATRWKTNIPNLVMLYNK